MDKKATKFLAIPAVLLSMISVQCGAAIAKGIFPVIGPVSTTALRIIISAFILVLFNRPNLRNLTTVQWKAAALYGLSLGAMNLIFYLAISRIPLAIGVALEFIGPLVLAIAGSKRIIDFLWICIAIIGLVLITPWHHNRLDIIGVLLALFAGALWASYIVLGGRISKIMEIGKAVTIGMIFASLIILPFAIIDGLFIHVKSDMLLPGFGLALLSSAIPFSLEMSALRFLPAKTFSILMSIEPALAAVTGLIFLHEYLSLVEWFAIIFIIAASAGSTLTSKESADSPLEQF